MKKIDSTTLQQLHKKLQYQINIRINSFKKLWEYHNNEYLLMELIFCMLTPQSNALLCWEKTLQLLYSGKLFTGTIEEISNIIHPVRFKNKKATYIKKAVNLFGDSNLGAYLADDTITIRDKLVKSVDGLGYKEASHFLRNIGIGLDLAILDRHILNCMVDLKLIDTIPKTLTPTTYKKIEHILQNYSNEICIPISHIDFILWYIKKGYIFK